MDLIEDAVAVSHTVRLNCIYEMYYGISARLLSYNLSNKYSPICDSHVLMELISFSFAKFSDS